MIKERINNFFKQQAVVTISKTLVQVGIYSVNFKPIVIERMYKGLRLIIIFNQIDAWKCMFAFSDILKTKKKYIK